MPDTQGDYINQQLQNLNYFLSGKNPYGSFSGVGGAIGSGIRGLGNQFTQSHAGAPTLSQFQTSPLTLQMLQNYLYGNEQRAAGRAGSYAGGYAASKGYNPYAYSQHAMGDVYDRYANLFAQLPREVFQSQLAANQANFGNLAQIYGLQNQLGLSLPQGFDFFRDLAPGLLAAGGKIGASALG